METSIVLSHRESVKVQVGQTLSVRISALKDKK